MCAVAPIPPVKKSPYAFTTATIVSLIVTAVISIATAAMQYMQQQQAAEAQARNQKAQMQAQDAAIAANAALANRSYMDQSKQIQERQRQQDEAAVQREQGVAVQGAEARSRAITAAGEAGVSGLSIDALLNDFTKQEVDFRTQSRTNLGYEHSQTQAELDAAQLTAEGRTKSMQPYYPQPVAYPSFMGAALRVGGDLYGAYSRNKPPSTPSVPSYDTTSSLSGWGNGNW